MLEKMRWLTQAIAQQPSVQTELFPDFVEVADELTLGWEEAIAELPHVQAQLTPAQLESIDEPDEFMASISGKDNEYLWTIDALVTSAEWQLLRTMAGNILEQMKWPKTRPMRSNELYLRTPR